MKCAFAMCPYCMLFSSRFSGLDLATKVKDAQPACLLYFSTVRKLDAHQVCEMWQHSLSHLKKKENLKSKHNPV